MSRRVMVRYRVRPEEAERNEALVRAVYAELASVVPEGFAYATYKLPDGVSFVHVAASEDDATPLAGSRGLPRLSGGDPRALRRAARGARAHPGGRLPR